MVVRPGRAHILTTARFRLRPCARGDAGALHRLCTDAGVRRYLFDGRVISLEEVHGFIERSRETFARHGYGLWTIRRAGDEAVIGLAGLLQAEATAPNLVFALHPDYWGAGGATEAARGVLAYAWDDVGLTEVRADVDEPNRASVRVLEKLGMRRVGAALVEGRPLLYFAATRAGSAPER